MKYLRCRSLSMSDGKVVGARTLENSQTAVKQLADVPGTVLPHQLDVTDSDSIAQLAQWVEQTFGRLDILINNASIL